MTGQARAGAGSEREQRVLCVVIGSRCFERSAHETWARRVILRWLAMKPEDAVVISGGAEGPDTWAAEASSLLGLTMIEYRLDGLRWVNGEPATVGAPRWTEEAPPARNAGKAAWKAWCLKRDRAIVKAADVAACSEWRVVVLGLVATWSATQGTDYTLERLRNDGYAIDRRVNLQSPPRLPE